MFNGNLQPTDKCVLLCAVAAACSAAVERLQAQASALQAKSAAEVRIPAAVRMCLGVVIYAPPQFTYGHAQACTASLDDTWHQQQYLAGEKLPNFADAT
jgi:hypothetical protein